MNVAQQSTFEFVSDFVDRHHLAVRLRPTPSALNAIFDGASNLPTEKQTILWPFVQERPWKFFDRSLFVELRAFFGAVSAPTVATLPQDVIDEATESLRFLRLANDAKSDAQRQHDANDNSRVHRLHTEVFSEYSRLAEHVLGPLLALLLHLDLISSGRQVSVPRELRGRWEMARSRRSGLPKSITATYVPSIRNSIVHGGVTFGEYDVTFTDISGAVEVVPYAEAERLCFHLQDTCNAIFAALVRGLADGDPLSSRMLSWARAERALASSRTVLTSPDACYVSTHAGTMQAEIHGQHTHWFFKHLLIDVMRIAVVLRSVFPEAARYFISLRSPRGAPCFYNIPREAVPKREEPFASLKRLGDAMGKHGAAWIEHETLAQTMLSKTPFGAWFNLIQVVDRSTSNVDYELRELKNISVGWRSRFDAHVVSSPRATDLDADGKPTLEYLHALFNETLYRWTFRENSSRPLGVDRLRVF